MTDKDAMRRYNLSLVQVNDRDNLHWVKAILYQMQADRVLSKVEHGKLFVSLMKDQWDWHKGSWNNFLKGDWAE